MAFDGKHMVKLLNATTVGDATGETDVCMMWKNHFSSLYNSVHADHVKLEVLSKLHNGNKCIADDTKAAARQSLNCKQKKYGENGFQYAGWNFYTLQCGTITT